MRTHEKECCGCAEGFHCPECDGHNFGIVLNKPNEWVVECHNKACGWSGPYDEHVKPLNIKKNF